MKKKISKTKKIIAIVLLFALIGVGAFFGATAIYKRGVQDGRNELTNEVSNNVVELAEAVFAKTETSKKINELLSGLPSEIDTNGIDQYIEKITNLIDSISNEEVSIALDSYRMEWEKFRQVYETEDNAAISDSFNNLKDNAIETAAKIKEILDDRIKAALNALNN